MPIHRHPTSASNLHRRDACPGSERAEQPFAEKDSEFSTEGTLLHRAFFNDAGIPALTADQVEIVVDAEHLASRAFAEFTAACGIPEDAPFIDAKEIELRLVDVDGNELPPGHADIVRTWPDHAAAFVADAKFGYKVVEEAPTNLQLALYACGVFQMAERPLNRIGVGIVQPRAFGRRISTAIYQSDAIDLALAEIKRIADAAKAPDAPRRAGTWCDYCKAKTVCEEFKSGMLEIELLKVHAVSTANNEQLARLKRAIQFSEKVRDEVNEELRRRIEAGEMPGWKLRNTGSTRDLFDATGAFLAMQAYLKEEAHTPLTAAAFDSCRKITWEPLEKLFTGLTGMTQKKAKETLRTILSPFVVKTEKAKAPVEDK